MLAAVLVLPPAAAAVLGLNIWLEASRTAAPGISAHPLKHWSGLKAMQHMNALNALYFEQRCCMVFLTSVVLYRNFWMCLCVALLPRCTVHDALHVEGAAMTLGCTCSVASYAHQDCSSAHMVVLSSVLPTCMHTAVYVTACCSHRLGSA